MQILFLFLFGSVVCFILYLSYDKYITDKNKIKNEENLEVDLNKYSEFIETNNNSKEERVEMVVKEDVVEEEVEVVKFKAKRDKNKDVVEEEII